MELHGPITTTQLAKILELPERKIFSYIERGYLSPSIQDAGGRGTSRLWSYQDAVRGAAIKHVLDVSSVKVARVFASWMDKQKLNDYNHMAIIASDGIGPRVFAVELPKDAGSYEVIFKHVRLKYPVALVVDFSSIGQWIQERIHQDTK